MLFFQITFVKFTIKGSAPASKRISINSRQSDKTA
jgi:hypothetical protein